MAEMAMLVDYEWCTGCHSCEIACQMEHGYPRGRAGLAVSTVGPWEITKDTWEFVNHVAPTQLCDACLSRRDAGRLASCEHHCQARCLRVGTLAEMEELLERKPNQALYRLS